MILTEVYQQSIGNKWVKKWHCSNCDWTDLDSVGYIKPKGIEHMIGDEKMCPKCKSMGKDDYITKIRLKIDTLTEQRSNIDIEIEKLTSELVEAETKETKDA